MPHRGRHDSVTKKNPRSLVWDLECTFGVVVYRFLDFEYLFSLKALICLFSLGAIWELFWESEVKRWLLVVLCLLSYLLRTWFALWCFVYPGDPLFVIWLLCHLKLVKVILANDSVLPFRKFRIEFKSTCLFEGCLCFKCFCFCFEMGSSVSIPLVSPLHHILA